MRVAIFSRTPLAAAPYELWKAIRKYTAIDVSLINQTLRYNDGRTFPGHLVWSTEQAREAMTAADLWHVHNYYVPDLGKIKNGQGVIAQFHSLPRLGNWRELMAFANVSTTIRQPLQMREYADLHALPNLIDPDEYRPVRKPSKVTIGFAPTSKAPIGHPSSKGYGEVLSILGDVASVRDVDIEIIENLNYKLNLDLKSRCHILIDDVVTGNWHRTSLEGACFACAVLNNNHSVPFIPATLKTLKERLLDLIDSPGLLSTVSEQSRAWVESEWHAMDLVREYVHLYEKVAADVAH